jgi:hypothetical protein
VSDTQTLNITTITGPKKLKAPSGWKFDQTAITVWSWLLNYTYERDHQIQKRRRDEHELDAKIHALAIVLANALGMAPPYWENAAKELMNAS